MNAINAIHPYKSEGLWVFDDARVGLEKEPFVSDAEGWLCPALFKYLESAPEQIYAQFKRKAA